MLCGTRVVFYPNPPGPGPGQVPGRTNYNLNYLLTTASNSNGNNAIRLEVKTTDDEREESVG